VKYEAILINEGILNGYEGKLTLAGWGLKKSASVSQKVLPIS
jgi:hypothetical protein